jgi:hypothetical protein
MQLRPVELTGLFEVDLGTFWLEKNCFLRYCDVRQQLADSEEAGEATEVLDYDPLKISGTLSLPSRQLTALDSCPAGEYRFTLKVTHPTTNDPECIVVSQWEQLRESTPVSAGTPEPRDGAS